MKGNRLDELFRNGLESHKITAPESAWDKIEAGLPKQNKKGAYFWLSIAASLVLLATIGWLAFNSQDTVNPAQQQVLSEKQPELNESSTAQKEESTPPVKAEPQEELEVISPVDDKATQLPTLVANNEVKAPSEFKEEVQSNLDVVAKNNAELAIEFIRPQALKPQFLARNHSARYLQINTQSLMQSIVLSPEELQQFENESKKKFGFLEGIVSMAKGVNNGAKALSEIRKSKNEFITNDLKYGDKTDATTEDTKDEGPNLKQR